MDAVDLRSPVAYITRDLLAELSQRARGHARGRVHHNFHELCDGYQRMLNVMQPGSYVAPHRHLEPAKSETFVVLQGEIGFFCFDNEGRLTEARRLGPDRCDLAVDLRPGVWHCMAALQPDTVVFEGKNGPYDPLTDKTFAPWAPAEEDERAPAYLEHLLTHLPASTRG